MFTRRSALVLLGGASPLRCLAQAAQRTVEVPARINQQGQFLVQATLHAKPLWFMIDTGGGAQIYLSRDKAIDAGLKPTFAGRSAGPNDSSLRPDGRTRATLEVGGISLPNQAVVIKEQFRNDVGVIGAKVFESAVIEFSHRPPAVTFHPRASFQYRGPGKAIPFELWSNNPHVVVDLTVQPGDSIPARMTVDTGAGGSTAYLTPAFDEQLRRLDRVLPWQPDGNGAASCHIQRLAVGPYSIAGPSIHRLAGQGFGGSADAPDGLLGTGFLRQYRMFLDYSRKEMILEPYTVGDQV